ncbi:MAG: hypothetical protein JRJ03_18245 [Deltaproteobacteria bacterium]|nr:hypothetical protein [Deltaproteobacteria bacterium]
MGRSDNKRRWFIIKHEDCGSVFTINTEKEPKYPPVCLTCGKQAVDLDKIRNFLRTYRELIESLSDGFTMEEIPGEIDTTKLKF